MWIDLSRARFSLPIPLWKVICQLDRLLSQMSLLWNRVSQDPRYVHCLQRCHINSPSLLRQWSYVSVRSQQSWSWTGDIGKWKEKREVLRICMHALQYLANASLGEAPITQYSLQMDVKSCRTVFLKVLLSPFLKSQIQHHILGEICCLAIVFSNNNVIAFLSRTAEVLETVSLVVFYSDGGVWNLWGSDCQVTFYGIISPLLVTINVNNLREKPDPASFFPQWDKTKWHGIDSTHENIFEFGQQSMTMLYVTTVLSVYIHHQLK